MKALKFLAGVLVIAACVAVALSLGLLLMGALARIVHSLIKA